MSWLFGDEGMVFWVGFSLQGAECLVAKAIVIVFDSQNFQEGVPMNRSSKKIYKKQAVGSQTEKAVLFGCG